MAVREGKLNGLKTPNCKGVEKVRRLYAWAASEELEITVAKTVSDDDQPLFNISERRLKVVKGEIEEIW